MVAQNQIWARWSAEEDMTLREMAHRGASKDEVAIELGRTYNAVCARAVAIRVKFRPSHFWGNGPEPEIHRRRCLKCRHWFDAPSRYRFVCDLCHESEVWQQDGRGLDSVAMWT